MERSTFRNSGNGSNPQRKILIMFQTKCLSENRLIPIFLSQQLNKYLKEEKGYIMTLKMAGNKIAIKGETDHFRNNLSTDMITIITMIN